MKYGYFTNDKEYIITRPNTPTPWMNYLNNGKYCAMVSNTGGGYSFYIDPKENRILRYRYNNIPVDRPGRYIYLRDKKSSQYWSPTWQPTLTELNDYECRHGLGYTKIKSTCDNITSEILYFVPVEDDLEIWMLTLQNNSPETRNIDVYSYVEFCLWDAISDQRDLQYIQNVAVAKFDAQLKAIVYQLFDKSKPIAYFYSDQLLSGYDCDRESFIGRYRSENNPICVETGSCSNSKALGGNPIAATCSSLEIEPNEKKTLTYILGITKEKSKIPQVIIKYKNIDEINNAFEKLKQNWDVYLKNIHVKTPDEAFNQIINTWNQYQCKTTFDWARYASFYETGIGRGIGFRDFNQDTLGACHAIPHLVRSKILEIARTQFENGMVYHQYFPLTGLGGFPDYSNPRMKFFADDHLWMVFSVSNYLKETGDCSILNEQIPFVEGSKATLYEHLCKAINFTENNLGPSGFPLIGTADWNDTMQLHGPNKRAESVMVAMQYHKALLDMSEIASAFCIDGNSSYFKNLAKKHRDHINNNAWDGKWYIRAIDDDGNVIGSKSNEEGQIFLNTQTWSVYGEVAPSGRALECMNSVRNNLVTTYGVKLFSPAYTRYYPNLGGISTFPPGLKENAAIFCHTNPWAEIAECILGRGDIAYEYYKKISPSKKNDIADIHQTEPYVYSQMIAGNDHPQHGIAKNSWLTGTASWTLKAATDWILGIRPEHEGLKIDPCIPEEWRHFELKRRFRGVLYDISVQNPECVSKGVDEVLVDGKLIEGNIIPPFNDNKTRSVRVLMG